VFFQLIYRFEKLITKFNGKHRLRKLVSFGALYILLASHASEQPLAQASSDFAVAAARASMQA
jgi:hypothetical protein